MTVVIILSDCPQRLRGDMTKWFIEINTGVYVGNVSARVRDEVWERITENIGKGHASMVFSAHNEQHMDFRVHNAYWEPVDFDGLQLIRRPEVRSIETKSSSIKPGFSSASQQKLHHKKRTKDNLLSLYYTRSFIVLDIETTGLNEETDEIIEIGAILFEKDIETERLHFFVNTEKEIPPEISQMTEIDNSMLKCTGVAITDAIERLKDFSEDFPFVCHNAEFERKFLQHICKKVGMEPPENNYIDTLEMSRALLKKLDNYRLQSLADHFGIEVKVRHRAIPDCEITAAIYRKLKELGLNGSN